MSAHAVREQQIEQIGLKESEVLLYPAEIAGGIRDETIYVSDE